MSGHFSPKVNCGGTCLVISGSNPKWADTLSKIWGLAISFHWEQLQLQTCERKTIAPVPGPSGPLGPSPVFPCQVCQSVFCDGWMIEVRVRPKSGGKHFVLALSLTKLAMRDTRREPRLKESSQRHFARSETNFRRAPQF